MTHRYREELRNSPSSTFDLVRITVATRLSATRHFKSNLKLLQHLQLQRCLQGTLSAQRDDPAAEWSLLRNGPAQQDSPSPVYSHTDCDEDFYDYRIYNNAVVGLSELQVCASCRRSKSVSHTPSYSPNCSSRPTLYLLFLQEKKPCLLALLWECSD